MSLGFTWRASFLLLSKCVGIQAGMATMEESGVPSPAAGALEMEGAGAQTGDHGDGVGVVRGGLCPSIAGRRFGSLKGWMPSLLWEGGSVFDSWLVASAAQVLQNLQLRSRVSCAFGICSYTVSNNLSYKI